MIWPTTDETDWCGEYRRTEESNRLTDLSKGCRTCVYWRSSSGTCRRYAPRMVISATLHAGSVGKGEVVERVAPQQENE